MILNFELEMVIKDRANTVPGIAYPIPARFVINRKNKFLLIRLVKEKINENMSVINEEIKPRPIVLNERASNSKLNPDRT